MSLNGLLNAEEATSGPAAQAAQDGTLPKPAPAMSLEADGMPAAPPAGVEAAAGYDAPMPMPAQEALNIHQTQEPQGSLYHDAPQLNGGIAGEPGIVPDPMQDQDPVQPVQPQDALPQPSMSADVEQPLPGTTIADQTMEEPPSQPVQHESITSAISAPASISELGSAPESRSQVAEPAPVQPSQIPAEAHPAMPSLNFNLPQAPTEQPEQQQLAAKTLHQPPPPAESPAPVSNFPAQSPAFGMPVDSPALNSATSEMPQTATGSTQDALATPGVYPPTDQSLYPPPSATNGHQMTDLPQSTSPADVNMGEAGPLSPAVQKRAYEPESSQGPPSKRHKHSASRSASPRSAPIPQAPMSKEQQKFCNGILKALKKSRDAPPFLAPVDPVALGIPHYPNVITHPMDLSTIEYKLSQKHYRSVDEFTGDMRLMVNNCYKFNGESSPVGVMAKGIETLFNKQLAKMPVFAAPLQAPVSAKSNKKHSGRRQSDQLNRPKRESNAPLPYDAIEEQTAHRKKMSQLSQHDSDMRFCSQVLKELMKKGNAEINWIFLRPVDPVELGIPDYFNIVKRPMDLGTMKQKLDNGMYRSSNDFYSDFKLMIKNCQTYNAAGSNPYILAAHLDQMFENKWAEKAEISDDSASDSDDQILLMEQQLEMMRQNIDNLKAARDKRRADRRAQKQAAAKAAKAALRQSSSNLPPLPTLPPLPAPPPKQPKAPRRSSQGGPRRSKARADSDEEFGLPAEEEVTWGMKQELANSMGMVSGEKLEKAIDIIRKARPDLLGDGQEIELDIDSLDTSTLLKLYHFAVGKPGKPKAGRRESTLTASGHRAHKGGRAGTGGLKGKSLDEDQESAYIAQLEARLNAFDGQQQPGVPGAMPPLPGTNDNAGSDSSESGSDSDSDSD